jgi:hypothetical protein
LCDAAVAFVRKPVVNYLNAGGIRVRLRPIERAAFFRGWANKRHQGLIQGAHPAAHPRQGDRRADLAERRPARSGATGGAIGLGLVAGYAFSAPYEDVTLKAKR